MKKVVKALTKIDKKIHKFLLKEMIVLEEIEQEKAKNLPITKKQEQKLNKVSKKLNKAHNDFIAFKDTLLIITSKKRGNPKCRALEKFLNSL